MSIKHKPDPFLRDILSETISCPDDINPRVPHHEARAIADRLEVALFSYVGLLLAGDAKEATERIPEGGSRVSDLVSVVRDLS